MKRVRHPRSHAPSVDLVQVDETAGLGFLDSFGISDPAQRLQADRLTDCQDIHHIADRLGEYSRWVLPSLPKSRIGELIADTVSAVVVSSACGCGATGDDGACAGGELGASSQRQDARRRCELLHAPRQHPAELQKALHLGQAAVVDGLVVAKRLAVDVGLGGRLLPRPRDELGVHPQPHFG